MTNQLNKPVVDDLYQFLADSSHAHGDTRADKAERRGELNQLKLLKLWAEMHELCIDTDDLQHFIDSITQNPSQPLARESIAAILKKEDSKAGEVSG